MNFDEIKKLKYNFNGKGRNFLRKHIELIKYLKNMFGDLQISELNYLINHEKIKCACGKNTEFINHDKGYKKYCAECNNIIKRNKISEKAKNRKVKTLCPKCGNETINGRICNECKSKVLCVHCKEYVSKSHLSDIITQRVVCKNCELDYFLKSNLAKSCKVNHYQYKHCLYCGDLFKYNLGGYNNDYCKTHRYKCEICGKRFWNDQKTQTCSKECSKILHEKTYIQKYGVSHNLKLRGSKKISYRILVK